MDAVALKTLHTSIITGFKNKNYRAVATNLSKAKLYLVSNNLLFPSPSAPRASILLAREILEIGALNSIHQINKTSFRRYHAQLQPFYDDLTLPKSVNQEKIIGLYLLLLLSENETAEFHTVLEVLGGEGDWGEFVKYPVMLERWLMEGSYDKIWEATRGKTVPSEEFGQFSKVPSIPTTRSWSWRLIRVTGHGRNNPQRNRPLLRTRLSVITNLQCKKSTVSGFGSSGDRVCEERTSPTFPFLANESWC